jgi:HPt (histidine-containing phosphotransfer) domain-containing protein
MVWRCSDLRAKLFAHSKPEASEYMTHPVLDPRLGVERAYGDPVTWRDALDLLYGLLPEYAENLSAAFKSGDTARMHSVAHGLSGAASYCGTVAVHVAAKQLEARCLHESAHALHEAVNVVLQNIDRLIQLRQSGGLPVANGSPVY